MKMRGVECPECGGMNTPSITSNLDLEGNRIRKRHCEDCEEWFTTAELAIPGFSFNKAKPTREVSTRRVEPQYLRVTRGEKSLRVLVVDVQRIPLCRKRLHPFEGDNIYTTPKGERSCRACRQENARERYHHARRNAPPAILEDQRAYWRELHRRKRARDKVA